MSLANRRAAQEAMRSDPKLSPGARLLLWMIGDLVADDGLLEAGTHYLAEHLGAARSSVQRWRDELVDRGHLVQLRAVKGGQGNANAYALAFATDRTRAVELPTNRLATGSKTAHELPARGQEPEQNVNKNRVAEFPPKNDPAACRHRAMDDEGWCSGCSSQVKAAL